ncbi:MAG: hypothetical protein HC938_13475 [Nitrospira sp.]|nr:hypothetical protein [Nitrospira sp.]
MVEQISFPEGFEVVGFQDGPAALEAARRSAPSLIIADYHLDNMTFSGFCKEINKLDNLTETSLISLINSADHPDETHLRTLGVKAFLKNRFSQKTYWNFSSRLRRRRPDRQTARVLSGVSGLQPRLRPTVILMSRVTLSQVVRAKRRRRISLVPQPSYHRPPRRDRKTR